MYAAPFWAIMHSLSYSAPYLSYASLYRATPHPTELCTLHLSELPYTLWATLHRSWSVSNLHSYNCLKCRNAGRWHIYVIRPDKKMPISEPVRHQNDPLPDWDDLCQNANTGNIGLASWCPAMLSCNYTTLGSQFSKAFHFRQERKYWRFFNCPN